MQNAITIETITNLTMSSREIAELLGSRHRDVCICIERLMDSDAIEGVCGSAVHPPAEWSDIQGIHDW